jgi:hypothetical protein
MIHEGLTFASIVAGGFGLWWTVTDIRAAIRSLNRYLAQGTKIFMSADLSASVNLTAEGTVSGKQPTTEERVERLEGEVRAVREEMRLRHQEVTLATAQRIQAATSAVQDSVRGEIEGLKTLVIGSLPKGKLRAYRGPAMVGLSLLCALFAKVAALAHL